MTKILGFNESQYDRIAAMLRAYESGTLWPSEKARNPPRYHPENHIRFHNDSGETIPPFAVMRITGTNIAGTAPWRIKCGKPNTTFYRYYAVNCAAQCAVSDNSWCTMLWDPGYVLYDTGNTPAIGETWGPQDGTWTLKKGRWGFNIIAGNAGSGATSKTLAVQHVVNHVLGKTNASHAKSASGTVNLYAGTLGSETQVTSMTVTAYNRFAAVGSGKWVHCSWVNGGWDLSAAEC